MHGIVRRDGGFAEYMITSDVAIMKIPDDLPFERKNVHTLLLLLGMY
jgi:propanol-preferring alcohol dehydrogenase